MLPQLLMDKRTTAQRIQRAAVRYYAALDDQASKVEALYHRLMLDQSASTLDKYWDHSAAGSLMRSSTSFPPVPGSISLDTCPTGT